MKQKIHSLVVSRSSLVEMSARLGKIFAVLWVAAVSAACAGALAQQAGGSFDLSFDVDGPLTLDVSTGAGSIVIERGGNGRARVTGEIEIRRSLTRSAEEAEAIVRRFESDPPVELVNGRLQVGHIEDRDFWNNVSISYRIEVPESTAVDSGTGSGSQTIVGIDGGVEVRAGSGRVTLSDLGGTVVARTGSGSISAQGIEGDIEARAGSGSIRVTESGPGVIVVATGSGDSVLQGIEGSLEVNAGSGSVTVDGEQFGSWDLRTGSGPIVIRLPDNAAFDLDARAGSGPISVEHPVEVRGAMSRNHLVGKVRGGGALLQARTGSGGIRIE